MANEVNYGRIALIPRGDFAGDVQYDVGDVVSYEGSSYLAKRKPPIATLPTDTEYWQISSQGSGGGSADRVTATDPQSLGFTNAQGFIDVASEKLVDLESNFLTAIRNVYVDAANGDDTTGNGSQEKPWKTIQKAVDMCPSITSVYIYVICVADGTYNENVAINNKNKLALVFSDTEDGVILNGNVELKYCKSCFIQKSVKINGCLYALENSELTYQNGYLNINGLSQNGIYMNINSTIYFETATVKISNCATAIHCGIDSDTYFHPNGSITIDNSCTYGLSVCGGIIRFHEVVQLTNNAEVKYSTISGGRIEFGSQGYQLIGSVTGTTRVAIDSDLYTEFLVYQKYNTAIFEHHIVSQQITPTSQLSFSGSAGGSTALKEGQVVFNKSVIGQDLLLYDGSDVTASTTMTVYGKR